MLHPKILALICLCVLPFAARAEVLDCKINAGPAQFALTERYIFDHDVSKKTVQVLDGMIQHFKGGPIAGKVAGDTAVRTDFTWSVQVVTTTGQGARLLYHATYFKADKSIVVASQVGGGAYRGSWDARGNCTVH